MLLCLFVVLLSARASVFIFVFESVTLGGSRARRVKPGDATPIVQSRPAREAIPRPLQPRGSAKRGTPCGPCTLQKGFTHDEPARRSQ